MRNVDDDTPNIGLSGWAWYELGRASAEDAAAERRAVQTVFTPRRSNQDIDGLVSHNRALLAENARLRQALADYELNYSNLRAWADRAEARINELLKDRE